MSLPSLPLAEWAETKTALHLFAQIVGKTKLALAPPLNHWWGIPLYVTPRGLTSGLMPAGSGAFGGGLQIDFDLYEHELQIHPPSGETQGIGLEGLSVAGFYRAVRGALREMGIAVSMIPTPFDPARAGSEIPFAEDETHVYAATEPVERFHRILLWANHLLHEFRCGFIGKCSPVHFFWHSFDLAVTRFSGRPGAPLPADADPVTKSAYSHEVISHGFWPGDDKTPAPAFYGYAAPEPEGLGASAIQPAAAQWVEQNGSHLGVLGYNDIRQSATPDDDVRAFLASTYDAAASLAAWPREQLDAPR